LNSNQTSESQKKGGKKSRPLIRSESQPELLAALLAGITHINIADAVLVSGDTAPRAEIDRFASGSSLSPGPGRLMIGDLRAQNLEGVILKFDVIVGG
jgi:hypothetical protein